MQNCEQDWFSFPFLTLSFWERINFAERWLMGLTEGVIFCFNPITLCNTRTHTHKQTRIYIVSLSKTSLKKPPQHIPNPCRPFQDKHCQHIRAESDEKGFNKKFLFFYFVLESSSFSFAMRGLIIVAAVAWLWSYRGLALARREAIVLLLFVKHLSLDFLAFLLLLNLQLLFFNSSGIFPALF